VTKFAIEGLSEAMQAELAPLGIRVTIVEPGSFRTSFLDGSSLHTTANGVLVGDEVRTARAGEWALKPRDIEHAMWNPTDEPARIIEVLTPGGSERWFEELAALADEDDTGFADACRRHGIEFRLDSPWIPQLKARYGLT
jgi:NAD(P)-dependent dehydrogenase (short-subunit alcohol dehydrogenase family)